MGRDNRLISLGIVIISQSVYIKLSCCTLKIFIISTKMNIKKKSKHNDYGYSCVLMVWVIRIAVILIEMKKMI